MRSSGNRATRAHATRRQTIGCALVDSPAAPATRIVEKSWSWTDHNGDLERVISRDRVGEGALERGDVDELMRFRSAAPGMPFAHPTVEHYPPLFVVLGAAADP